MAQSYANSGGSGARQYLIPIKTTCHLGNGGIRSPFYLVDGTLGNNIWFDSQVSGQYLLFDFGQPRIIDEAKWYQDNSSSQGTWKFQGSNDNSSFTDVGTTFTLGGSTTQTITAINGNTTAYRWWKLIQTAGSTTSSPYTKGIEFQIDSLDTSVTQYGNTYGVGDRQSDITISQSQTAGHGDILFGTGTSNDPSLAPFVDNANIVNILEYKSTNLAVTGKWIKFHFPDYRVIDQIRWWTTTDIAQATWKLQGSNDNSTWTDVGTSQFINAAFTGTTFYESGSQQLTCFILDGCNGNTSSYIYYRMLGVSGSVVNDSGLQIYEIGFRIKAGIAPPSGAIANPLSGVNPLQGFLS